MQHPDEGTIHAWLDGALPEAERAELARHIASCTACSAAASAARETIAGASRIARALDVAPSGVVPRVAPRGEAYSLSLWRMLRITPARAALAASVIVALSLLLTKRHDTPNKMVPRPLVAAIGTDSTAHLGELASNRIAVGASAFVGCYELGAESASEPESSSRRFALELSAESAGSGSAPSSRNVVRAVSTQGRIGQILTGSSWHLATPMTSNVNLALPSGDWRLHMGLLPDGSVIASETSDAYSKRIGIQRIACTR